MSLSNKIFLGTFCLIVSALSTSEGIRSSLFSTSEAGQYSGANPGRKNLADLASDILKSTVKGEAGQIMSVKGFGAPSNFLSKRFPFWKENSTTYMIPELIEGAPAGDSMSHTIISINGYVDSKGAENKIYDMLNQFGKLKKIGMFVLNGFSLRMVARWTSVILPHDTYRELPPLCDDVRLPTDDESDFIIFHNNQGVISIEVETCGEETNEVEKFIEIAKMQLRNTQEVVSKLASVVDSHGDKLIKLFFKKVIALPLIRKSVVLSEAMPAGEYLNSLISASRNNNDILFLFAEDLQDLQSFGEWWSRSIDASENMLSIADSSITKAYESALSYMMTIRHLTPITDTNHHTRELLHSLAMQKFHDEQPQIFPSNQFPYLRNWLSRIFIDTEKAEEIRKSDETLTLKRDFIKENGLKNIEDIVSMAGMALLNGILKNSAFIKGETLTMIDKIIAYQIAETSLIFVDVILDLYWTTRDIVNSNHASEAFDESKVQLQQKMFPFTKMETILDLNKLGQHLETHRFISGDDATEIDRLLYESLTCEIREYSRFPMVMTTEQLKVFEGPKKQLIIGSPGSGKTELLKFKAKQLEEKIDVCGLQERILFIIGNGSPDPKYHESLLFRRIKKFFSGDSSVVDVISISLEEEEKDYLEKIKQDLRNRIDSGQYGHVFIDEYWIGSKPLEHEIIQELMDGIEGYVWITSVFDFNEELLLTNKKMQKRTQPQLDTLMNNRGIVNRIFQVARGTNHIISLEREYSRLYRNKTYPYGTKQILGHSLQGFPVKWVVEETVDQMYVRCVELVNSAINEVLILDDSSVSKRLSLSRADVLIVDFAIRTSESTITQSLHDRLSRKDIPIYDFDSDEDIEDKVTLLSSISRDASSYLDGVEWPMVVVILPSGLVRNEVSLATGAQSLRNYDPYISFFRAMVQLVIISDKWTNEKKFLEDIKYKLKL